MSQTGEQTGSRHYWLRVFIAGILLWVAAIIALWATKNTTLIPSVIFVGSFLVPVTFTVWVFERERYSGADAQGGPSGLRPTVIIAGFGIGGLFGVIAAALLEGSILNHLPLTLWYFGVAVIEETVKIAVVWVLARAFLKTYTMRDGMVLGASVGFGFAAFESAGYAFNSLIASNDENLVNVVETLIVRGFLAPVGHGLWTALIAGALFAAAAKTGKLHLTWAVFGWWCIAVLLHTMWDAANGLAALLALKTSGEPANINAFINGAVPNATSEQLHLFAFYQWLFLSLCAVIGIILANRMWVKGRALVPGYPYGPHTEETQ